jgi:hypothetical protein
MIMTKVVINGCYGGFGLSYSAILRYAEIKDMEIWPVNGDHDIITYWLVPESERVEDCEDDFHELTLEQRQEYNEKYSAQTLYDRDIPRDDPALVQVVEELGEEANGRFAELKVIEIPDDVEWQVEEYDGAEWVAEKHRTWA